jgi:TRAP-type mannitol/chloroaromatic compound transport system substrate-binding protein
MLPGGELFQALEKGVLDGTEFSLPTVDDQLGFDKVAKNYYLPGWHQPSTNQYLYVNMAAWAKLKPQTQAQIETTCTAGVTMALAKAEALQGEMLAKFEKEGVNAAPVQQDHARRLCQGVQGSDGRRVRQGPDVQEGLRQHVAFQNKNEQVAPPGLPAARLQVMRPRPDPRAAPCPALPFA